MAIANRNMSSDKPNDGGRGNGPWMTKEEVAQYFCTCPRTINNWMTRRVIPHVKVGRLVRFNREDCQVALRAYEIQNVKLS